MDIITTSAIAALFTSVGITAIFVLVRRRPAPRHRA
jgi:hypothetical protein